MKFLKTLKNKWLGLAFALTLSVACMGAGVATLNASAEDAVATTPTITGGGAAFQYSPKVEEIDKSNMRVAIEMSKTDKDALGDKEVRILVMPTDMLSGELTTSTATAEDHKLDTWDLEGDKYVAYATLYNFPQTWYNRSFSWRAYYNDGAQDVYSEDTWSRCIAEVAKLAYTDDQNSDELKANVKPYCTYTASYDLGIRVENSTTEWQVVEKEALYGDDSFEEATAPTRDGFAFVGWNYTKGSASETVKGNVTAEAIWLLTDTLTINSVESLYAYADVNIPVYAESGNPTYNILTNDENKLEIKANGETNIVFETTWKNILIGQNLTYSYDTVADGLCKYTNFGYYNSEKCTFIKGLKAEPTGSGSMVYSTNKFIAYDGAKASLYQLPIFTVYQTGDANLTENNSFVINSLAIGVSKIYSVENIQHSEEGKTIINPTAFVTEVDEADNWDGVIGKTDDGFKFSKTAASSTYKFAPFIFLFEKGTKLEAGDKVVITFERGATDVMAYQGYFNGDNETSGTYFLYSNSSQNTNGITYTATNAMDLNSINILLWGTDNVGGRDITVTACYIIKAKQA